MLQLIRHLTRQPSLRSVATSSALAVVLCLSASGCSDSAPEQTVAQNDAASSAADPTMAADPAMTEMSSTPGGSTDSTMMEGPGAGHGADSAGSLRDTTDLTDTAQMEAEYGASGGASSDPSAAGHAAEMTETDPALTGLPDPGSDPLAGSANAAGAPGLDPASTDPATAFGTSAPGVPGESSDPRMLAGAAGDPTLAGVAPESGQPNGGIPGVPGEPGAGSASPEGYPGGESGLGGESGPGGPGAGGAGAAPPADAPEYPAFQLVMGLMKGEYKDMEKYVSRRARGDLQKIGAGKLTDGEKTEYKETFAKPQLAVQPRNARGGRQIVLQSGEKMITILVKKEGDDWRVSELSIREARRR